MSQHSFYERVFKLNNPDIGAYVRAVVALQEWRIFQTSCYSYAYEQLRAVTLFIKHNSSTLYWQLEVKMAFIQHKARARGEPAKSPVMTLSAVR